MRARNFAAFTLAAALTAPVASSQAGDRKGEEQPSLPDALVIPPAPPLSPEEELATLQVPDGFVVELVAAEPLVVDPVQVVYDELGRLWVVEMRGYMPDIVGTGEKEPVGRIAILTDTDGDGAMDERVDFAKDLVLPRGVMPMHGGALCLLPPELVFLRDDDGDGEFDVREVVATGLTKGLDNPEHDVNTPLLGLDNWVHFANWSTEVRRTFDEDGEPVWETRKCAGGGQWGLSTDDVGRLMRNTNPRPLFVDVVPSRFRVRNPHQRGFVGTVMHVGASNEVHPRRINPGVNRGYQPATLRDDYTLHWFTGACSPTVLRGDGLGADANGDVFVCEPTGNLVKRYDLSPRDGDATLVATSVHDKFDFMTSTDERFRPVAGTTAPDGTLIVADFYRGLIQHRIFLTSFLREQIEERGLTGPMGLGRIWRVRRSGERPAAPDVDLLSLELEELVPHLASTNSWLRDWAQRLLVEQVDGEAAVIGALRRMARGGPPLGRLHALWTLDGLGYLDTETLTRCMTDDAGLAAPAAFELAGMRAGLDGEAWPQRIAKAGLSGVAPRTRLHALFALGEAVDDAFVVDAFASALASDASSALERSAVLSGLAFREAHMLRRLADDGTWREEREGRAAFLRDLAACIGRERLVEHTEEVVALALAPPAEWWIKPLLDGLDSTRRKGPKGERLPIELRSMPLALVAADSAMPAAGKRVDESCVWPGKPGAVEIAVPRALTVAEQEQYERGRIVFEMVCSTCHQSHGAGEIGKAPTLRGTRFVVGDEKRLVSILLHGLHGEIEIDGEKWDQEMPRFEGTNAELADVATYIRRSWGNGADPVTLETVQSERAASAGRSRPMSPKEIE